MAGRRVCSIWPSGLRDEAVANNAQADAEIAQTIAGRSRWLIEMVTGGPAVVGDTPLIPRNPQGLYGHDHSGPPYGSAFRHPLFYISGHIDPSGSDLWTSQRNAYHTIFGVLPDIVFDTAVWVRPFAVFDGAPYGQAEVNLLLRGLQPDGESTLNVTISSNDGPPKTQTLVFDTGDLAEIFTLDAKLDLRPGENTIRIELRPIVNAADLIALAVSQVAKRSH